MKSAMHGRVVLLVVQKTLGTVFELQRVCSSKYYIADLRFH